MSTGTAGNRKGRSATSWVSGICSSAACGGIATPGPRASRASASIRNWWSSRATGFPRAAGSSRSTHPSSMYSRCKPTSRRQLPTNCGSRWARVSAPPWPSGPRRTWMRMTRFCAAPRMMRRATAPALNARRLPPIRKQCTSTRASRRHGATSPTHTSTSMGAVMHPPPKGIRHCAMYGVHSRSLRISRTHMRP